jgi:hypothetical protein
MPGFDGTGPAGLGPRTGGGFGHCLPGAYPTGWRRAPGVVYGVGRGGIPWGGGRGRAFGGGRGWWRRGGRGPGYAPVGFFPAFQGAYEKSALEAQVELLEQQLADVKERLAEIDARSKETSPET